MVLNDYNGWNLIKNNTIEYIAYKTRNNGIRLSDQIAMYTKNNSDAVKNELCDKRSTLNYNSNINIKNISDSEVDKIINKNNKTQIKWY